LIGININIKKFPIGGKKIEHNIQKVLV
jgi:hypothetical protein